VKRRGPGGTRTFWMPDASDAVPPSEMLAEPVRRSGSRSGRDVHQRRARVVLTVIVSVLMLPAASVTAP